MRDFKDIDGRQAWEALKASACEQCGWSYSSHRHLVGGGPVVWKCPPVPKSPMERLADLAARLP